MNRIFRFAALTLPFSFFISAAVNAQVNDAGLWISLAAEKKITQKLSLGLSQETRFDENISRLATSYTDVGAEYRIFKFLSAGIHYRYVRSRQLTGFYEPRQRFYADVSYRYRNKPVIVTLRQRLQAQYRNTRNDSKTKSPESYLRSKLTVKFDLDKKYFPYISTELFFQLNNDLGNEIDNIRYAAGFDYELNNFHAVGLYYLINKEIHVVNPETDYVIGAEYKYSF